MDALKLVSTIGNNSSFGQSASDIIHVEDEEDIHVTTSSRISSPDDQKKRRGKKISVLHPPDGGIPAWKMVGVCFFINFCKEFIRNIILHSDGFSDEVGKELAQDIYNVYSGFSKFGGVFAAVISIRYGYGMVGIIGCITAASGLLLASLCTTSLRGLIALLVSCVSGIGTGFMEYAILVVVLEYFSTKRVKVIIIVNIATTAVNVIFSVLLELKNHYPELVLPWSLTFRYQAIGMAVAVIASGFIRTLELEPEPDIKKIYRHHHLQYSDFSPKDWNGLVKDLTFYLYIVFFLLYDFAEHLPDIRDLTENQKWAFDSDQLMTAKFVPYMGFACASLVMCAWKNQTLSNILAVLGPINFIAGLATCVILPYTDFGLIVFYGIIFVVAKHCILWMMLDVIPDEFGRNNTRVCLGIVCFVAGVCEMGSAYAKESAEDYIEEETEKFKAVFILSGALIMASGLFGIFIRCLIVLYKDPEYRRRNGEC
ncbi:monocarboxylate transporter 2-like [Mytilus edulis]|uniref:monocarboxylate transporter 2-like n=1 Tax=Mytilus edulis TaxID=6550 RepID=UPI0039EFA08F